MSLSLSSDIDRLMSAQQTYTPAAVTRAGEYLVRIGMKEAAVVAARDAVDRARGLLPAYVLGVKCALIRKDKQWTLECIKKAIQASLRPPPLFYEKLVALKSDDGAIDSDSAMVHALINLRSDDPHNPLWTQMLGFIRLKRGGWEAVDALQLMNTALEEGATNVTPYMIAAQASWTLGNAGRAVDLLRAGLEKHPGNPAMLNNLVFMLSNSPDSISEALELVPRLLESSDDDPDIMNTAAFAWLRAGQLDKAERILSRLIKEAAERTPAWFRARMHQAETAFLRSETIDLSDEASRPSKLQRRRLTKSKASLYSEARAILTEILEHSRGMPGKDIIAANKLLQKVENSVKESRE